MRGGEEVGDEDLDTTASWLLCEDPGRYDACVVENEEVVGEEEVEDGGECGVCDGVLKRVNDHEAAVASCGRREGGDQGFGERVIVGDCLAWIHGIGYLHAAKWV